MRGTDRGRAIASVRPRRVAAREGEDARTHDHDEDRGCPTSSTFTRSTTLATPTNDAWAIYRTSQAAYDGFRRGRRAVRLLGVTGLGMTKGPVAEQLTFEGRPRFAEAELAVEKVRRRWGKGSVGFARLLHKPEDDG